MFVSVLCLAHRRVCFLPCTCLCNVPQYKGVIHFVYFGYENSPIKLDIFFIGVNFKSLFLTIKAQIICHCMNNPSKTLTRFANSTERRCAFESFLFVRRTVLGILHGSHTHSIHCTNFDFILEMLTVSTPLTLRHCESARLSFCLPSHRKSAKAISVPFNVEELASSLRRVRRSYTSEAQSDGQLKLRTPHDPCRRSNK